MSDWQWLQTSLLIVLLILLVGSCLILWNLTQLLKRDQTVKALIELVDKQSALLASRTPLDYQAIQAQQAVTEYQDFDPSDEGELARINRRNSALYSNDDTQLQRVDTQEGEYGGGVPFLLSP